MPEPLLIDYKRLRKHDPETARRAVLDYLEAAGGNVSATARAFGIQRAVVYDIQRRARDGALADRSRAPHHRPTRTPKRVEDRVVAARNRTGLGYQRLARYLAERGLDLPWSTIRNILRRNRDRLRPLLRPSLTGGYSKTRFEIEYPTESHAEGFSPRYGGPTESHAEGFSPRYGGPTESHAEGFSPRYGNPPGAKPAKPDSEDFYSLANFRRRLRDLTRRH